MSIKHKFQNIKWEHFETLDSILYPLGYEPEILFIGTYNPDFNDEFNTADFFYGRNYFWPAIDNILTYKNDTHPSKVREDNHHQPDFKTIENLCIKYKLTFADLINEILIDNFEKDNKGKIKYNGIQYDLISDSDLEKLDQLNDLSQPAIDWNLDRLTTYLKNNTSIKTIYLTKLGGQDIFSRKFDVLKSRFPEREFRRLYTPSGVSLPGKPKLSFLIFQWLMQQPDNRGLDTQWLASKGIKSYQFKNGNMLNWR